MRNGEGDLAALKTIGDAITALGWVSGVGGTIGTKRAQLTDDAHQVNQVPKEKPSKPNTKVIHGINEKGTPMASSMP